MARTVEPAAGRLGRALVGGPVAALEPVDRPGPGLAVRLNPHRRYQPDQAFETFDSSRPYTRLISFAGAWSPA